MEVLRKAFSKNLQPELSDFVGCIEDDAAIVDADIDGSIAHCTMLARVGLISQQQAANIKGGLESLRGNMQLLPQYEDVHMNVEKQLQAAIGNDALRLHTARSRNDQVALDMRVYTIAQAQHVCALIRALQLSLIDLAEQNVSAVMPGYTHLQRAQPVAFGHAVRAFVEMLERDLGRFADCIKRASVSPLGAGALAGSSLPIDPLVTAELLGFDAVFANSIDAVSDRDFIAEFLSAAATCAMHLSQLAETFILWTTSEFNFLALGDDVTTTSSLMPNKKNPDPLEIVRAKCGAITGDLVSVLMILKGLPLGYNRDLQETKPPLIRTCKALSSALTACRLVMCSATINEAEMFSAASDPMLFATDIVEYLVRKGCPFREAHEGVAEIVGWCRQNGEALDDAAC